MSFNEAGAREVLGKDEVLVERELVEIMMDGFFVCLDLIRPLVGTMTPFDVDGCGSIKSVWFLVLLAELRMKIKHYIKIYFEKNVKVQKNSYCAAFL